MGDRAQRREGRHVFFGHSVDRKSPCIGSHQEIHDHLRRCRDRWGISFYTVRDIPAFAPVIAQLS